MAAKMTVQVMEVAGYLPFPAPPLQALPCSVPQAQIHVCYQSTAVKCLKICNTMKISSSDSHVMSLE
jgi:hypothetical protein